MNHQSNYPTKFVVLLIPCFLLSISCHQVDIEKTKLEVIDTDRSFSRLSEEVGTSHAFLAYADEDGVLLRDHSQPIIGRQAIDRLFREIRDEGTLSWEPLFCDVSVSGDMAYTYGTYLYTLDTLSSRGTYVSIWKKNDRGEWKFVLDSGNQGLE